MTLASNATAGLFSTRIAPERVHQSGTAHFREATRLWNGAVAKHPDVVVQPVSAHDVQAIVRIAADNGLSLAVRSGGHDWAGRALTTGGVVIDMSLLRDVTVDTAASSVRLGGGALTRDVATAAGSAGLAPAAGAIGEVGMVGLTLAGGYGWLTGLAGLALDNLQEVELVLADGATTKASADHEVDLFWALRGGGGNFGVVTAMRLALHHIPVCTAGVIAYPWTQSEQVLAGFDDIASGMPDELTVPISVATGPDGEPMLFLWPVWSGTPDDAAEWMNTLTKLGQPVLANISQMPYTDVLEMIAPYIVWGRRYELRTRNIAAFTAEAIATLVTAVNTRPSEFSGISIHHFHGAATRVPLESTAFGVRQPHFLVEILAGWTTVGDDDEHREWAETLYRNLADHALAGGYPSLIGPGQSAQAEAAYGPNADRLRSVKAAFDPTATFNATTLPMPQRL
jgi:FAD/FMN-containing dehydrogenase